MRWQAFTAITSAFCTAGMTSSLCRRIRSGSCRNTSGRRELRRACTAWGRRTGHAPVQRHRSPWRTSLIICLSSMLRVRWRRGMPLRPTMPCSVSSRRRFPTRRRRISCVPLRRSSVTWSGRSRWIASSAAMWASARPRLPCAPHSRRRWTVFKWRCSYPQRFSRSSTIRRLPRALRILRRRWMWSAVSAPCVNRRRRCTRWRADVWISSSARMQF